MSERRSRLRMSMRLIVTTATVAIVATVVILMGWITERNARSTLEHEIETRLLLEARNLALASQGALLTEFPELTLQPLVKEKVTAQPELVFAVVVDHEGRLQGHPDARRLDTPFELPSNLAPEPTDIAVVAGEGLRSNEELLVASAPVLHPSGRQIGTALVALSRSYLATALASAREQQVLLVPLLLALGVISALVLMSVLLRPVSTLRVGIERIGAGDLDTPIQIGGGTELGVLADTVNEMAGRLKIAQHEMVEKERLAHEVNLARQIQQSLLPHHPIQRAGYRVLGAHREAAEVGGDYFDYFPLPDGRIGIAIADVSGKGLAGCLVMSMLSALLHAFREYHDSPSSLLATLDGHLGANLQPGAFVTMFYGILDPLSGRVIYASAGHSPTLHYRTRNQDVDLLPSKGIPLGAVRGGAIRSTLQDQELVLEPGDLLIQFTDGYHEAFDAEGENLFGLDRMVERAREAAPRGAVATVQALTRAVSEWSGGGSPSDDETLLLVARETGSTPPPSGSDRTTEGRETSLLHSSADDGDRGGQMLERAEREGHHLQLGARLEELRRLRTWLGERPELAALGPRSLEQLEVALYELCANIVEHGYGLDGARSLDLWWVSGSPERTNGTAEKTKQEEARHRAVRDGYFLVRDHGEPFRPLEWQPSNLNDARVRRRGRGFGLDIIHGVMQRVQFHPGTKHGNLTCLTYDPAAPGPQRKETERV